MGSAKEAGVVSTSFVVCLPRVCLVVWMDRESNRSHLVTREYLKKHDPDLYIQFLETLAPLS